MKQCKNTYCLERLHEDEGKFCISCRNAMQRAYVISAATVGALATIAKIVWALMN